MLRVSPGVIYHGESMLFVWSEDLVWPVLGGDKNLLDVTALKTCFKHFNVKRNCPNIYCATGYTPQWRKL